MASEPEDLPQGVLAPDILLREAGVPVSDRDLMQELVDFVNWAIDDARLVLAEVGDPARGLYLTDQYIAQVRNGGHTQYVGNVACFNRQAGTLDLALTLISQTLADCLEEGYLNIFRDFEDLLRAHEEITAQRHRDPHQTPHYVALNALDDRFFMLDGDMLDAARAGLLRGSPSLRRLSAERLPLEKANIIARNVAFEGRGRAREHALQKEPMYFAPRRLCQLVGLDFVQLTAGSRTAKPDEMFWGVATSGGIRSMLLGPNFAELYDKERQQKLARIEF
jgi:hypothetical protein